MTIIEELILFCVLLIIPLLLGILLPYARQPLSCMENIVVMAARVLGLLISWRLLKWGRNKIGAWVFFVFYGLSVVAFMIFEVLQMR